MFRKRVGAPKKGEAPRPVLFFVHASSVISRVIDLNVPGKGEYSVMNELARNGFDCWTMDHENYGKSGRTSGNSDIASGVEDLKAAVKVVAQETGREKFHFLGEYSGALRAGAYAMVAPERIDRLVFAAFIYKGEGSPTLTKRAEQLDHYRSPNMRKRDRDMIRSIATRDKPGTSDVGASRDLVAELHFDVRQRLDGRNVAGAGLVAGGDRSDHIAVAFAHVVRAIIVELLGALGQGR